MALTKKESTREGSRMKAQDQKELMRERICDCAKRLFEREGYEQVSMRQIAAGGRNVSGKFGIIITFRKRKGSAEGAFKRYSGNFFREHPAV